MKVALIGGTGKLGRGLAVRLKSHDILIGSRDGARGADTAKRLQATTGREMKGGANEAVAKECDLAVLAIPDLENLALLTQLKTPLEGKIVISPIVPMRFENGLARYARPSGSAAEEVASVLARSRTVAALHNVPAPTLATADSKLDFDVLVTCDRREDYDQAAALIGSIDGLRALYAGPLYASREIEALTPLLLNTAKLNALRRLSTKFVS